MKKFRLEDYKGNYLMNTKKKRQYDIFCKFLDDNDKTLCNGVGYLNGGKWSTFRKQTCIDFNVGQFCDTEYHKNQDYIVLDFSDFNWGLKR